MQVLENSLAQLHLYQGDPADIIYDIKSVSFRDVPIDQLGLLCSLLLHSDNSLLRFLDESVTRNDSKYYAGARNEICIFLSELITFMQRHHQSLSNFVVELKTTLISLFRKEDGNKVREKAVSVLNDLLSMDFPLFEHYKLELLKMTDMFLTEYAVGKCSVKVKANILKLLGMLLQRYPEEVKSKSKHLQTLYMDILRTSFKSKKPDLGLIAGSLEGICSSLHSFADEFTSNAKNLQDMYRFICFGLDPPKHVVQYHIPKASMRLIGEHAFVFRQYLTEDSSKMFERLRALCIHNNKTVSHAAITAMEAFFQQVAHELVAGERSEERNAETFKCFLRIFFQLLDNQSADTSRNVSIAIMGFGKFAGPMLMFLGLDELKKLLARLLHYSDKFFSGEFEQAETIYHLPSFINAFSNIILQIGSVEDVYLEHLEKLACAVFVFFPQINVSRSLLYKYYQAMSRLFTSLYIAESSLDLLLSKVAFKALVLTCSNQATLQQQEQEIDLFSNQDPYKVYEHLWRKLLVPDRLPDIDISDERYKEVCQTVYNQLIQAILQLLKRLNVKYTADTTKGPQEEPTPSSTASESASPSSESEDSSNAVLVPEVPKDFEIFLNLVEFSKDIIPYVQTEFFLPWIYVFGKEVIKLSNRYPLISGFYKFLAVVMNVCEKHSYFSGLDNRKALTSSQQSKEGTSVPESDVDSMNIDDEDNVSVMELEMQRRRRVDQSRLKQVNDSLENIQVAFSLFSKFIKEVLLRIQQYKNELLAACVKLVLSVPSQLVSLSPPVQALQIAFRMGLRFIDLADVAVDALEYWLKVVPNAIIPELPRILPYLNDYLRMDSTTYEERENKLLERDVKFRQRAQAVGRGKLKEGKVTVVQRTRIAKLQYRILRLIGKLGGHNVHLAEPGEADGAEKTVVWDTVPRVQFSIPFKEMKPLLYLDNFLPRIVELAESSQERQVKVSACELLHSVTLFMVGSSANIQDESAKVYKLYEHIFPALIRLATDVEQVAKQLFQPLVFQLIHWFTKNVGYENTETMKLLDAIIDAVGNPNDGALRAFSAKCLSEFLEWSIKQSKMVDDSTSGKSGRGRVATKGKESEEKSPINVKSLFKRLYSLAHHPDSYKRLGYALTLNQFYRLMQDNEAIVNHFILEILHNTIFSLRLSHFDDPSIEIAKNLTSALKNLTRITCYYAKMGLLLEDNKKRRQFHNLEQFVAWVFGEIVRPESDCRHECMHLFMTLAPLLPKTRSPKDWVQRKVQMESVKWLLDTLEPNRKNYLPSSESPEQMKSFYIFLETLVDDYYWMFKEEFIDPSLLVEGKHKTCLFDSIKKMFDSYALLGTEFNEEQEKDGFKELTPNELEQYNNHKTQVLTKIYQLIILLLNNYNDLQSLEALIASSTFFDVLFRSILAPHLLGFNLNVISLQHQDSVLALQTQLCTAILSKYAHSFSVSALMQSAFTSIRKDPRVDIAGLDVIRDNLVNVQEATALVEGYGALLESGIFQHVAKNELVVLPQQLSEAIFTQAPNCSPTQLLIAAELLRLCFAMELSPSILLSFLLDDTPAEDRLATEDPLAAGESGLDREVAAATVAKKRTYDIKQSPRGMIFCRSFSQQIIGYIRSKFRQFCPILMQKMDGNHIAFRVILAVLDSANKASRQELSQLIEPILESRKYLDGWYTESSSQEKKENLLELLRKMLKNCSQQVTVVDSATGYKLVLDVFLAFMQRSVPLAFKVESMDLLESLLLSPSFSNTDEKERLRPVKEVLRDLTVYDFPVKSQDLVKGSTVYGEYLAALDKILASLYNSGNSMILEILLPVLREANHIHKTQIETALEKYISRLDDGKAEQAFELCFSVFLEQEHQYNLRKVLVQKLCVPLTKQMTLSCASNLFSRHVCTLMDAISDTGAAAGAGMMIDTTSGNVDVETANVVKKTCCFLLIEVMYNSLPSKVIRENLNEIYCKRSMKMQDAAIKGNELTTAVMKLAHTAKSRSLNYTGVPSSICHEFHSTAFNTLAAVVMCTQSKERFFTVFFFKENREKKEYLWEHIINLDEKLEFPVETHFPVVRMHSEAIRRRGQDDDGNAMSDAPPKPKYMSSQYFADSSLSQDMSYITSLYHSSLALTSQPEKVNAQFENIPFGGDMDGKGEDSQGSASSESQATKSTVKSSSGKTEEVLELDAINTNLCMPVYLALLDHMEKEYSEDYRNLLATGKMPEWMELLYHLFVDESTHFNVKVFVAKLIINRHSMFASYASAWLGPLMSFACSPHLNHSINYFVRDICITILLHWSTALPRTAEEVAFASRLFDQLMRTSVYSSSLIVRYNLDLIKLFVERFKGHFQPNKQIILEMIACPDDARHSQSKMKRVTGLQLLGVLVANSLPFYDPRKDSTVSEVQLIDNVVHNLRHTTKNIHRAASEIVGLILSQEMDGQSGKERKIAATQNSSPVHRLATKAKEQVKTMLQSYNVDQNLDRSLECLSKIGIHCPSFLDPFFLQLFDLLPKLFGVYSVMGLELVLLRASHIDGLLKKLHPILDKLILQRNTEAQLVTLKLFKVLLPEMNEALATQYVEVLSRAFGQTKGAGLGGTYKAITSVDGEMSEESDFGTAERPSDMTLEEQCRVLFFDILMWIYDRMPEMQNHPLLRVNLLQGLYDSNPSIAESVFRFWNDPQRGLSNNALERLEQVFSKLYAPEVEEHWLKFASNLLLHLASYSSEYETPHFPALTNAQFFEYRIDGSFQNLSLPMSPMFASQSLASQPYMGSSLSSEEGDSLDFLTDSPFLDDSFPSQSSSYSHDMSIDSLPSSQSSTGSSASSRSSKSHSSAASEKNLPSTSASQASTQPPTHLAGGGFVSPSAPSRASKATSPLSEYRFSATYSRDNRKVVRIPRRFMSSQPSPSLSTQGGGGGGGGGGRYSQYSSATQQPGGFTRRDGGTRVSHPSVVSSPAYFAGRDIWLKRQRKKALMKQLAEKRRNRVMILRSYRTGELPDVQIKPKEILLPMQAILQKDSLLARQMFASLFKSLVASVPGEQQRRITKENLKYWIEDVLSKTHYSNPVVSCLQWICFEDEEMIIDSSLIARTALQSHNYHTGVLLLEKQLLHYEEQQKEVAQPKRGKGRRKKTSPEETPADSASESQWMQLIKLYKALGDEDVLLGLYEKHLCTTPFTKKALESELEGDYKSAHLIYEQALDTIEQQEKEKKPAADRMEIDSEVEPLMLEVQLWETGRMECLVKLLNWQAVAQNTQAEVGQGLDSLWKEEYRVPYLRYYICSQLRSTQSQQREKLLKQFVEPALTGSAEKRHILETEFLEDLAFLYISGNDFDRSRYYVHQSYDAFLRKWSSTHPLATVTRRQILKSLQRSVEMDEFLYFNRRESNFLAIDPLTEFLSSWHQRHPSIDFSDITVWNDVVGDRIVMFDKLLERYSAVWSERQTVAEIDSGDTMTDTVAASSTPVVDLRQLQKLLAQERSHTYLSMATAARKQNNLPVAELQLKNSHKTQKKNEEKSGFSFPFFKSLVKLYTLKALKEQNYEKFNRALEYVEDKRTEKAIVDSAINTQQVFMLEADILCYMAEMASEDPDVVFNTRHLQFNKEQKKPSTMLYSKAFRFLDKACKILRSGSTDEAAAVPAASSASPSESSLAQSKQAAKAYFKLAVFCDNMLVQVEEQEIDTSNSASCKKYAETIVTNVMDAMALQYHGARDRFPRVLQLLSRYPNVRPIFEEKAKHVPTWMYIRWISQMMGLLDQQEGRYIAAILLRIANDYPQSLYYPFRISSETFSPATKRMVEPLSASLRNPQIEQFIEALQKLTHPEHRFKDWTESVKPIFASSSGKQSKLKDAFQEVYNDCFNAADATIGSYNRTFALGWSSKIQAKFGKDGSKLASMDLKQFTKEIISMQEAMTNAMNPKGTSKMKLSDFSNWLVNYDQSNLVGDGRVGQMMEIPGQYSGLQCPVPANHIFISSFDSDILVMGSLRKPKRLKIRGNDQQDHPFLVKGGEDLRLDQRVQQLFSVMNEIFRLDNNCTRRRLHLPTYQVVPMTSKVGLIEWIDNTKPLKAIIEEELAKLNSMSSSSSSSKGGRSKSVTEQEHNIQKVTAARIHDQWLKSFARGGKLGELYGLMYQKASRTDCLEKVRKQYDSLPGSLLRSGVLSLSSSPEAYLAIRSHFARSLAAFNISSYIIGIGDRHLENFLLNYRDGGLVGIDFGHAFGTATQFLPVPELVPFRLTRQFTHFLKPLETEGLLTHNMIHCLRALQNNKEILLNTMNVFITEPLLDWEKLARRAAREKLGSDGEDPSVWFPREKLKVAKMKLTRCNPAHILVHELRTSLHATRPYTPYLELIVLGDETDNVRARVGPKCDSVAQQVECLVDLASDPNVLGRMYGGWAAWI